MIVNNSYNRKHTPIPQVQTLTTFKAELKRSQESLERRKLTPEEHAEIIAKYGAPIMTLKERRNITSFKKGRPA